MDQQFFGTPLAKRLLGFLNTPDNRHALIVGPPGVGKSTLLKYLGQELSLTGALVATVAVESGSSVDDLIARIARAFAVEHSVPEAQLLQYQSHLQLLPLFEAVSRAVGTGRQIFLIVDDLDQSFEARSIALLFENLVSKTDRLVRVILASRPGSIVSRLQRSRYVETFELRGLALPDAMRVLRANSADRIPTNTMNALVGLADGNPLLLRMMASLFRTTDSVQLAALSEAAQFPERLLDTVFSKLLEDKSPEMSRVLAILSVFEVATVAQLTDATGLTAAVIQDALLELSKDGLVVNDRDSSRFSHRMLQEGIISRRVLIEEILVADLTFGDEAAERDTLLPTHFVAPPDLDLVLKGTKTIILGDRGSGKSAIFRSLEGFRTTSTRTNPAPTSSPVIVASSKQPADFLQQFTAHDAGGSSADRFKALWLLYVSALAASEVHSRLEPSTANSRYVKSARHLLRQVGWGNDIKNEPWVSRTLAKFKRLLPHKVAFTAGPVTIAPEWEESSGRAQRGALEIGQFLKHTDDVLSANGLRVLVAIDQIDEAFKYQREIQEALVQGVFLAESYLSSSRAIRLIVLLRTDLFGVYDIQEKNKFVSRTIHLKWSWVMLIDQMLARIYTNKALQDVASKLQIAMSDPSSTEIRLRILFPNDVQGTPIREWLIESLRNGRSEIAPRQVILFLNFIKDRVRTPRRRIPLFDESEVLGAMQDLSESTFQEVISDFRVATAFVRNCRAAKLSSFKLVDVEALFEPKEGSIAVQVELLERLGFIEREVVIEGGSASSRFKVPTLFTRCWSRSQ